MWVPTVLFGFEGKFGVRLSKERQEIKNVFNLSFLFKLCLLYLFNMGRGV